MLEAAWANVWILDADGALLTPPADGRILPGITRARLLAAPHLRDPRGPAHARRRSSAREAILLTSSVRLATPAGLRPAAQRSARASSPPGCAKTPQSP